jgi:hypothetical protein
LDGAFFEKESRAESLSLKGKAVYRGNGKGRSNMPGNPVGKNYIFTNGVSQVRFSLAILFIL